MSRLHRWVVSIGIWLPLAWGGAERAGAMGMESFGPAGEYIGRSPDWARCVEDVLRHSSRVYWYDVNGSQAAYYDGDIQTINELLALYSSVDLAQRPVIIRPGRPSAKSFHGKLTPYVVEFEVPGGLILSHVRKYASTGL